MSLVFSVILHWETRLILMFEELLNLEIPSSLLDRFLSKLVYDILGTFFHSSSYTINIGQALSIRPDILSPRAMVELQQLCDKVPCFDSELAMQTIEQELGRSPSDLFSEITAEPVAAASLGQVLITYLFSLLFVDYNTVVLWCFSVGVSCKIAGQR